MLPPTPDELRTSVRMYDLLKLLRTDARRDKRQAKFAKQLDGEVAEAHAYLAFWADRLDENGVPIATDGAPVEPPALRGVP